MGRTTDEGSASATTKPSDGELHERLSSVKEAIAHLHEVPDAERGTGWYAYRDVLESKRAGLTGDWKRHETAVIHPSETR